MKVNVALLASSEAPIITYFGSPLDSADYSNQGTRDTSDPRWTECYSSISPFLTGGMPSPPAN